jgi:hypothetical protein
MNTFGKTGWLRQVDGGQTGRRRQGVYLARKDGAFGDKAELIPVVPAVF